MAHRKDRGDKPRSHQKRYKPTHRKPPLVGKSDEEKDREIEKKLREDRERIDREIARREKEKEDRSKGNGDPGKGKRR